MNIERLERLVELLEKVNEEKELREQFDMEYWVSEPLCEENPQDGMIVIHCGCTACALGFAALDSEFNNEGLLLDEELCPYFVKESQTYYGFEAASKFFEISVETCFYLFSEEYYREISELNEEREAIRPIEVEEVINRIKQYMSDING